MGPQRSLQDQFWLRAANLPRNLPELFVRQVCHRSLRDAQCLLNGLGRSIDDDEISTSRALWLPRAMLPVAQRVDAEAELGREGLLRQVELRPDLLDVNVLGDMNAIRRPRRVTTSVVECFLEAFRMLSAALLIVSSFRRSSPGAS